MLFIGNIFGKTGLLNREEVVSLPLRQS